MKTKIDSLGQVLLSHLMSCYHRVKWTPFHVVWERGKKKSKHRIKSLVSQWESQLFYPIMEFKMDSFPPPSWFPQGLVDLSKASSFQSVILQSIKMHWLQLDFCSVIYNLSVLGNLVIWKLGHVYLGTYTSNICKACQESRSSHSEIKDMNRNIWDYRIAFVEIFVFWSFLVFRCQSCRVNNM